MISVVTTAIRIHFNDNFESKKLKTQLGNLKIQMSQNVIYDKRLQSFHAHQINSWRGYNKKYQRKKLPKFHNYNNNSTNSTRQL